MKYFNFLLVLLLTGCATLPPAGPSDSAMKKADKIYLTVQESPDQTYKSLANYLSSEGFTFENSDEVIHILKTEPKNSERNRRYSYSIDVNVRKDSTTVIQFSGEAFNEYLGELEISNTGMNNSIAKDAWLDLKSVAENYPHEAIYYGRN